MKLEIQIPEDFGDQLVQSLVKIQGEITRETAGIINQALLAIETRAKGYAPVDTGRLRSSIHTVPVGKSDTFGNYNDNGGNTYNGNLKSAANNEGTTIGMVGTNVEYAPEQEFGNGDREGHKYLTKATAEIESKIQSMFKGMKL